MTLPVVTIASPTHGLFDHRYDLVDLLGQGHYGEVWKARDTNTGRVVALKILDGTRTTPDAAWQEATRLTSLESPFLIRVHGAAMAIDVPYLDMELAPGGSAGKAAQPYGVVPHVAVGWMRQVVRGLHLCHQRQLLHRDVKPDNVFLDAQGDARLGDFGITAIMDQAGTAKGDGDPQIRAPEVLKGGRCSVASEVYSAGVTLHSFLTGRLPHQFADHSGGFASFKAAAVAGPPDIRDVAPHVDLALAKVVRKATSIKPGDRYDSMAAFDLALSRLTRGGRDIEQVRPHPGAVRCWDATPRSGTSPRAVHVCTIASSLRKVDVEVRYQLSGNRLRELCVEIPPGGLLSRLRQTFTALR